MQINESYLINDKHYTFNLSDYIKKSLGISREFMPQIDYKQFFKYYDLFDKNVKIMKILGPVNLLKPIQNEINMHKVLMNIEKNKDTTSDVRKYFFCSNDFYLIDGHHRHVEMLMKNPLELVDLYVFDMDALEALHFFKNLKSFLQESKNIKDQVVTNESHILYEYDLADFERFTMAKFLNESYGVQGPEASPGMSDVSFGIPTTSAEPGTKGSGDIPTASGRFYTQKSLLAFQTKANSKNNFLTDKKLKEIADEYRKRKEESMNEDKEVHDKNTILKKHFKKEDVKNLLDKLKPCINIKKVKYYLQVDEEFSCETMEGIVQGKKDDYLMVGVDGELYPVDKDIFKKTYKKIPV